MLEALIARLRPLFRKKSVEGELDEELRFHVERQTEEYVKAGMAPQEAARRARLDFGGLEQVKEEVRQGRSVVLIESLLQDLRYGVRVLARSPGFTAVAVLSLALGIGANTMIFSLLDQVVFRPLPVRNPEQLVAFRSPGPNPGMDRNSGMKMSFSYPKYADLRDRNTVFSGVIARFAESAALGYRGQSEMADLELVSGNYFEVLGVRPALGRLISPADDLHPMAHPVAVLSYEYWMRRFGGDPSIVGQAVTVNDTAMTVIGVSEPGFSGVQRRSSYDARVPMMMKDALTPTWRGGLEKRDWAWLNILARLRPGVTPENAEAEINVLYRQILAREAEDLRGVWKAQRAKFLKRQMELVPARKGILSWGQARATTLMISPMAMAALVLLIACVNLANLVIARTAARGRELAVRLAMGAGSGRVARQLLTESLLLAFAGGALGLAIAFWAGRPFLALVFSEDATRLFSTTPDLRVLAFTMGVSLATAVLVGLGPMLRSSPADLPLALKSETGASAGRRLTRLRKILVTAQVAICVWLMIAAGLFARTLRNLRDADMGFRAQNLITFSVDPFKKGYKLDQARELYQRIEARLAALAGVRAAAHSDYGVLRGSIKIMRFDIEGYQPNAPEDTDIPQVLITPGYIASMGLRLVAGRGFTAQDMAAADVALVNLAFARRFLNGGSPIGRHIRSVFGGGRQFEIVGMVADVRQMEVRAEPQPVIYFPSGPFGQAAFYVRTDPRPETLIATIRKEVEREAPGVPVYELRTMQSQVDRSLHEEQRMAVLAGMFGLLAVLLAAIGLYGVMAYSVTRRTREIGIRMALGARAGAVRSLVLREVSWVVAAGLGIGLLGALWLTGLVKTWLWGVEPNDPPVLAAATVLVAVVAGLAGFLPARRASRIDPMRALRWE